MAQRPDPHPRTRTARICSGPGPLAGGGDWSGTGDDTISVISDGDAAADRGGFDMGDGDDLLIVDGFESGSVWDGAGNETIRVDDLAVDPDRAFWSAGSWAFVSGEGNDVYELAVTPFETTLPNPDDNTSGYASAALFHDFEAGADRLVVNPYSLAGDATYTGYEISSNGSTGHQQVAFLYTHPDYPDGLAVAISLNGGDLTAADIEIVGGPNSAAA